MDRPKESSYLNVIEVSGVAAMILLVWLAGCQPFACEEPGTLCTMVGHGDSAFAGDGGKARDAYLYFPSEVTWRPGTTTYVITDWNNERLRQVDADGIIQTVIGTNNPGDGSPGMGDRVDPGAPGTDVAMNHPVQAEYGPDGRLYVAAWHNHKIRRWDPETGLLRTIVANHDQTTGNNGGFDGDGGPAETAHVFFPSSVAFDEAGNYYFVDEMNLRIRRVDTAGIIDTVLGSGEAGHEDGPPLQATFYFPDSVESPNPLPAGALEIADGVMWIADTYNAAIRRWEIGGDEVTTLPVGPGLVAPTDIELGPDGRLYLADSRAHAVFAVDREGGELEVVAGTGTAGDGEDGLPATEAALDAPSGIDFADDGALWIADTFNSKIRRVTP